MSRLTRKSAKEVELEPASILGKEELGLIFIHGHFCEHVGAQCKNCHTIVWVNARTHPILNEPRPSQVPECGPGYTAYYRANLARFLKSLPACPNCEEATYDRFLNNIAVPRLASGKEPTDADYKRLRPCDPMEVKVWVYE